MHKKSTNPTQTRQTCLLPRGLRKQNKLAVVMHVALIACKAFVSSAKAIRFPLCLPAPRFSILCLCMGVREEVLLNCTRKHNCQCCNTTAIQQSCYSSLATSVPSPRFSHPYSWQVSNSSESNVTGHLLWQALLLLPTCAMLPCSTPLKSDSSHAALFNAPEIRFKPKWESRPDKYTGKTSLIQLKCDCNWDYSLPCFNSPKPEKHINK